MKLIKEEASKSFAEILSSRWACQNNAMQQEIHTSDKLEKLLNFPPMVIKYRFHWTTTNQRNQGLRCFVTVRYIGQDGIMVAKSATPNIHSPLTILSQIAKLPQLSWHTINTILEQDTPPWHTS